jgi:eukaryotic-like serine/threonine-protein kinase
MKEQLGKYHVIDHLGNGHFGDVFLCFDPFLRKERAIKVVKVPDPVALVAAIKEGQALDVCRHKHIVELKDVDVAMFRGEVVVIIVMEYLAKGSIQKQIEKRFFSVKESCRIIQESLLGLEHAHIANFLHRDIKPGNILFGDNGDAKLSDFGLSINYHEGSDTHGYRPHQPLEVIEGAPMDKLSDIYGMGITLYRLINNTNEISFPFTSKEEWRKAVKNDLYPPREFLKHIPDKVVRIINKAINKNKGKRFQNCTEFRQAIEKLPFNIDWNVIDENRWIGLSAHGEFEISSAKIRSGYSVDYKKNGRRDRSLCKSFSQRIDAEDYIIEIVRSSTFK